MFWTTGPTLAALSRDDRRAGLGFSMKWKWLSSLKRHFWTLWQTLISISVGRHILLIIRSVPSLMLGMMMAAFHYSSSTNRASRVKKNNDCRQIKICSWANKPCFYICSVSKDHALFFPPKNKSTQSQNEVMASKETEKCLHLPFLSTKFKHIITYYNIIITLKNKAAPWPVYLLVTQLSLYTGRFVQTITTEVVGEI